MRVTIIGEGASGAAAVTELVQSGHEIALCESSLEALAAFQQAGGVEYEGVLGEGLARPRLMTSDLAAALEGCEAVVCTLPATSHAAAALALAEADLRSDIPIVLNPGRVGGALEFRAAFQARRAPAPPIAELSALTCVARKYQPQRVTISATAKQTRVAVLPGSEAALEAARRLFSCASPVRDVLASGLANVDMVLHPPGAILGAAWIEAKGGDFTFYVEGMTPGVTRVMKALDDERRAVARAFGHELPNLVEEMQRIGIVQVEVTNNQDFAAALAADEANRRMKAPASVTHAYYLEDFSHGLLPFMVFATIARVPVPAAQSLFTLAETLVGTRYRDTGRTAKAMGIAGMDMRGLISLVRQG